MTSSTAELSAALDQVLTAHLGRPVTVGGLRRLAGGSSHETWGFVATGADGPIPLVLRREFERSLLDTDVRAEYELLRALRSAGLPVPEPWLCVTAGSPLGLPFMVMERVEGTDLRKDLARGPERNLVSLGAAVVELQGRIHGVNPDDVPGLEGEWGAEHEVGRWSAVIEAAKAGPEPLLATALAWLRTNPPARGEPCLVHGDFKANNLLISPAGELTVLDWEMTHLGDPVEDLAWTMLWRTGWDVVGGLHTAAGYVAAYTAATGRAVEEARLQFWRVFALVKLWGIFLTGMAPEQVRPNLRLMGRSTTWLAEAVATELLAAVRA
jgi:aminoglycoside phosphotransferase (APT) family kinase protein